jgi:ribosomal-protein-alanine N-acetyltransferase
MSELFRTKRMRIRTVSASDFHLLRLMDGDPLCMKYIIQEDIKTEQQTRQIMNKLIKHQEKYGYSFWAWEDFTTNEFIGWGGLKYIDDSEKIELGYTLVRKHWGKKYATEACEAIIQYGWKELNFDIIYGRVDPENVVSAKVLKKVGMKFLKKVDYKGFEIDLLAIENPTSKQ